MQITKLRRVQLAEKPTARVTLDHNENIILEYDPENSSFERQGDTLTVTGQDGATFTLNGFFAEGSDLLMEGVPLADGESLPGGQAYLPLEDMLEGSHEIPGSINPS